MVRKEFLIGINGCSWNGWPLIDKGCYQISIEILPF